MFTIGGLRCKSLSFIRNELRFIDKVDQYKTTTNLLRHQRKGVAMSSNNTARCEHIKCEDIGRGKWVVLRNITYKDCKGRLRLWEGVARTTKLTNEADAVGMITVFMHPTLNCECVIMVRQFRPAIEAYTVEFPAGLIDEGETAAEAAVREMKEETGYTVQVEQVSPATALDAGIGNTTMKVVTCKVDMNDECNKDVQSCESDFVEVLLEPVQSLLSRLDEFSQRGDVVDSRVYSWALAKLQK